MNILEQLEKIADDYKDKCEELPELVKCFKSLSNKAYKCPPKSIRMFINQKEWDKTTNSMANTLDAHTERHDIFRYDYTPLSNYYYVYTTKFKGPSKYTSFAITVKLNLNRIYTSNSLKGFTVLEKTDDYVLYTANNTPNCLRVAVNCDWSDEDLKSILEPSITRHFN